MMTEGRADTSSNKDNSNSKRSTVSSSSADNNKLENVLILQGGGSLGAFGCGVFKALANNNIKLDIVAGTSIGGINAAIIAGSKDEKHPEQMLEQFWLELSQSFVDLDKVTLPFLPLLDPCPNLWKICWYHLVIIFIIYPHIRRISKEIILRQ